MARRPTSGHDLELEVRQQPDATTCGPTCLHGVYHYWRDRVALADVTSEVRALPGGGTLAVWLACNALRRGYDATIYTYNLQLFDPTWFVNGEAVNLADRLEAQRRAKPDARIAEATEGYLEFVGRGGRLRFEELNADRLRQPLEEGVPVLTGLSATYLYGCARERGTEYDDVAGEPAGHFVVVSGYDAVTREVRVADPLHDNPLTRTHTYRVGIARLIGAVLLGIVTYDANLLLVTPRRR
jgi:hypothetical protein